MLKFTREILESMTKEQLVELMLITEDQLNRAHRKLADNSWANSPDKSGGQFTDDEIFNARAHGW